MLHIVIFLEHDIRYRLIMINSYKMYSSCESQRRKQHIKSYTSKITCAECTCQWDGSSNTRGRRAVTRTPICGGREGTWWLRTGVWRRLSSSQGRKMRNELSELKCSNISGGLWTGQKATGQRSLETSGRLSKCGGSSGKCYVGRGRSRPYQRSFIAR